MCKILGIREPKQVKSEEWMEQKKKELFQKLKENDIEKWMELKNVAELEWKFVPPYYGYTFAG